MPKYLVKWAATVRGEIETEAEDENEACERVEATVYNEELWTRGGDVDISTRTGDAMVDSFVVKRGELTPEQRRKRFKLVKLEDRE